jgi:DNA-binding MarR family transcriptional regulator
MEQQELQQKKFRRCALSSVRGASRLITQFYDEKLQPSGLRATQFGMLAGIARVGEANISELAEMLLVDQTTLTRNLQLLKEQGLAESVAGEDQRTRLVRLTAEGERQLDAAIPYWQEAQDKIIAGMGQERYRALLKELAVVVEIVKS